MDLRLRFCFLLLLVGMFAAGNMETTVLNPEQILSLLNQDRVKNGLSELTLDPTLNLAALAKASDMIEENYFGHESPTGEQPWKWFKDLGYHYSHAGENLASGFVDAKELENSWMNSPTHRANILSPYYSEVGVAVVNKNDTNIVVQFFGNKQGIVTFK